MADIKPVFLLSLPRSGSTLLQRLLAAHPQISTASEPWLLLPHLYSLRPDGAFAEYGHATSARAISSLVEQMPAGRKDYLAAIRDLGIDLYSKAAAPDAAYFLDKTPRYALIVDELLETFPDSVCILLWRSPLAVVGSILDTWMEGRWMAYLHKVDLFVCLERLIAAYERERDRFVALRYEDLVADTHAELSKILERLALEASPSMVEDFVRVRLAGPVGDQTGVKRYAQVSQDSLERWKTLLASPVRKRWCRRYLGWIGEERLRLMGYSLEGLLSELDAIPTTYRSLPSDLLLTVKGGVRSFAEPTIMRGKLRALPDWRRIYSHS